MNRKNCIDFFVTAFRIQAMVFKFSLVVVLLSWSYGSQGQILANVAPSEVSSAFDKQFYDDLIDDKLCDEQIKFLVEHSLRTPFLDASTKIPPGMITGNINGLGDYHQCMGIRHNNMNIQGKYCAMVLPFNQSWPSMPDWSNIRWSEIPGNITLPGNITRSELLGKIAHPKIPHENLRTNQSATRLNIFQTFAKEYETGMTDLNSRTFPSLLHAGEGFTAAICIPKVCTSQRGMEFLQGNLPINITARVYFCRVPGDKPFVAGDYVAIVIFVLLGLLNVMSTTYDLVTKFYYKNEYSERSTVLCSFSVYRNTHRFLTFSKGPGLLDCIDGIRVISMMWVVVGHTFAFSFFGYVHNITYVIQHLQSFRATWLTSASISVDTFFTLTGILVVYSNIGKLCRDHFLRNIHMFYLHRLLRMFPLLAAVVLFQASLAHHAADGPFWVNNANLVQNCRDWWWSALLHVQNYVNPLQLCVVQTWYLSVDTQLYFISPLVLWSLWGHRRSAWAALTIVLLLSLVSSSIISFMFNFSAAVANFNRMNQQNDYIPKYYYNTLARAPPFFVGMIYGYMLHVYREKNIKISNMNAIIFWLLSILMMAFCIFSIYPVMQPTHTAQAFDNFLNAYMRAIWAAALGWVIFACVMGYGGPVNWFLSLPMWKLPARLSFAMYLLHTPAIMLVNGTWTKTHYSGIGETMYRFMSDISITFVAAFFVCVTVDSPCSTLQKLIFGGGHKTPLKPKVDSTPTIVVSEYNVKTTL